MTNLRNGRIRAVVLAATLVLTKVPTSDLPILSEPDAVTGLIVTADRATR